MSYKLSLVQKYLTKSNKYLFRQKDISPSHLHYLLQRMYILLIQKNHIKDKNHDLDQ